MAEGDAKMEIEDLGSDDGSKACDIPSSQESVTSEELFCCGCESGSKGLDPVAEHKGLKDLKKHRIKWARRTVKKVKLKKGGRKKKNKICGCWCLNCYQIFKKSFAKKVKDTSIIATIF